MATQSSSRNSRLVKLLLQEYGQTTFAADADIRLADKPAPLFQLLILALMLSARIASEKAVSATASLFSSGLGTPQKMADASWQERVDAITWSGYKRYDERTATMLGETAERVLNNYQGDLRKLHRQAQGDAEQLSKLLQQFKGVGGMGANIFLREAQGIWDDIYPFADQRVLDTAGELDLPNTTGDLSKLCPRKDFSRLTAALIRVALGRKQQPLLQQLES